MPHSSFRWFAPTVLAVAFSVASCNSPANAETPPRKATGPIFSTVGSFVALSVPDIHASITWYEEKLGLITNFAPQTHDNVTVAVLEGGGLTVELIENSEAVSSGKDALLTHGFFKVGVVVMNLDSTLAELGRLNVPIAFGPYPASGSQKANLIIRDNNGNLIQLFDDGTP